MVTNIKIATSSMNKPNKRYTKIAKNLKTTWNMHAIGWLLLLKSNLDIIPFGVGCSAVLFGFTSCLMGDKCSGIGEFDMAFGPLPDSRSISKSPFIAFFELITSECFIAINIFNYMLIGIGMIC